MTEYDAVIIGQNEPKMVETIRSVLNQSVRPHRVICVASLMQNPEIEGVEWWEIESDTGPSKARNKGISMADCPVVACFDGDVVVPEYYMRRALKKLKRGEVDMVGGSNRCLGGRLDRFNYRLLELFARFMDVTGMGASIIGNNFVTYRDYFIGFNTDMSMLEDADLSRRYRKENRSVRFYRDVHIYTEPRRVYKTGGWWPYLALYFRAYREYVHTGTVKSIKYFENNGNREDDG